MPKRRLPNDVWDILREKVWERDGRKCVHCKINVSLYNCHIDHIQSGKNGNNKLKNLRTLCKRCHVLRLDMRHRGMISNALKEGIISPDWRDHLWED